MMSCRELIMDFLMEYLDGELPPALAADFEKHLCVCPSCAEYLQSYRKTIELGRSLGDQAAPPPEGLVKAIMKLRPDAV